MKSPTLLSGFCAVISLISGISVAAVSGDEPTLEVRFTKDGVAFSGKIESEEYGLALAESVKSVRPDLKILNRGLKIVPGTEMPDLGDLKSLLAELGISTHEGSISFGEDSVTIRGMTDSRITLTALKIRLDPLLGDREFVNRVCIVSKDDLPKFSVHLSTGETSGPLLNFDVVPTDAETYEPPGLSVRNLFPMMLTLSDLSRLKGAVPITEADPAQTPMRAIPLLKIRNIGGSPPTENQPLLRAMPAVPQPTFATLPSILFSHNSFLLQGNQESHLDTIVSELLKPPLAGNTIILKPVKNASRGGAYGDYLVEKRGEATKSKLVERGISASLITIEAVSEQSGEDNGEVRLVVKIPPPPPEPEPEEEEAPEEVTPTETASVEAVE